MSYFQFSISKLLLFITLIGAIGFPSQQVLANGEDACKKVQHYPIYHAYLYQPMKAHTTQEEEIWEKIKTLIDQNKEDQIWVFLDYNISVIEAETYNGQRLGEFLKQKILTERPQQYHKITLIGHSTEGESAFSDQLQQHWKNRDKKKSINLLDLPQVRNKRRGSFDAAFVKSNQGRKNSTEMIVNSLTTEKASRTKNIHFFFVDDAQLQLKLAKRWVEKTLIEALSKNLSDSKVSP